MYSVPFSFLVDLSVTIADVLFAKESVMVI